ncbi:hypothetical protein FSPOR_11880 [Fusarium sporotrichioides]|uniref:Uncharacterized protein n=1 Tax=Fusarium sporotrichioides TaxID=5514 RepID=A0A395REH9_FUSSP|nr:hypothetical protein FSPOR_11880 [Fusarium sporotrichioides]
MSMALPVEQDTVRTFPNAYWSQAIIHGVTRLEVNNHGIEILLLVYYLETSNGDGNFSWLSMVDVIGLVSGVLTIVSFIQSQVPDKPKEGAAVRIKAGSGGTDDEGSGGEVSAAYAWNFDNNYLGRGDGGSME